MIRAALIAILLATPAAAQTIKIDCEALAEMMERRPALWRLDNWQALAEFCGLQQPVWAVRRVSHQNDRNDAPDGPSEPPAPNPEPEPEPTNDGWGIGNGNTAEKPGRRVGQKPSNKPDRGNS